MSFILDALKKSEDERQQQAGGEFSNVPSGTSQTNSFKWLWILAVLLLVNFAVLLGILMRDDVEVESPPATVPVDSAPTQPSQPEQSFEQKIATARENQPPPEVADDPPDAVRARTPDEAPAPAPTAAPTRHVPTFDELRVDGRLQMSDLHLDIHVYADDPDERFVFINMNKHRENSRLDQGPVVREITPDGVILEHQGSTFLLPRE